MAASFSNHDNNKLLRYICITTVLTSLLLWITVYTHDITLFGSNNISQDESSLCTIDSFNQGKWVYRPTPLPDNFTETDIANASGYHCMKKFAHRCFRRGGDELSRAKQM